MSRAKGPGVPNSGPWFAPNPPKTRDLEQAKCKNGFSSLKLGRIPCPFMFWIGIGPWFLGAGRVSLGSLGRGLPGPQTVRLRPDRDARRADALL